MDWWQLQLLYYCSSHFDLARSVLDWIRECGSTHDLVLLPTCPIPRICDVDIPPQLTLTPNLAHLRVVGSGRGCGVQAAHVLCNLITRSQPAADMTTFPLTPLEASVYQALFQEVEHQNPPPTHTLLLPHSPSIPCVSRP